MLAQYPFLNIPTVGAVLGLQTIRPNGVYHPVLATENKTAWPLPLA